MDDPVYRLLKKTAIIFAIAWLAWSVYDGFFSDVRPGDHAYHAANKYFEDTKYNQALAEYNAALRENPAHLPALRGKARTRMQLGNYDEALQLFNKAIAQQPEFPGSYANRGILHDRMGHYRKALADYEQALAMDHEVADGPNWLTRFLRLQSEKPSTIADRAAYLRQELAKPPAERLLRNPEIDQQQRSYQQ